MRSSARRARSESIALLSAALTSTSIHRDGCHSVSLPLLASSKIVSAKEVLEEETEGSGAGPNLGGGGGGGGESWSSSDGWSEDE